MGCVYRARDARLDRGIAIKVHADPGPQTDLKSPSGRCRIR